MKAMVCERIGPIEETPLVLRDLPDPQPGPGEVLVRVRACGVCRTDLHVIEGDLTPLGRPVVPGHQVVGRIERLGPGVRGFAVGDRVGIAWLRSTCSRCRFCTSGRENLCEEARFTGYHAHGGYAELCLAPADFLHPIPQGFGDAEAAPLLCGGLIGWRSLVRARCPQGGLLALYGFGSSAHIVIQCARHLGLRTVVVTRNPAHRDHALRLGAETAVPRAADLPEDPDSAIIFAPAGDLVPQALERLRKGGTLALAGIHMTDIPPLTYERHLFYEKEIRSVTANTRQDARDLLRVASEARVRPEVTLFPLEAANEALLAVKRGGVRGTAVLVVGGEEG